MAQKPQTQNFSEMGQNAIEAMTGMQQGFLDAVRELNQQWLSSVNAETALVTDFWNKLGAAKSIPDAAVACQGCANRQLEIFAENGRQFMVAGEKIMPKLFGNGFSGAGT